MDFKLPFDTAEKLSLLSLVAFAVAYTGCPKRKSELKRSHLMPLTHRLQDELSFELLYYIANYV